MNNDKKNRKLIQSVMIKLCDKIKEKYPNSEFEQTMASTILHITIDKTPFYIQVYFNNGFCMLTPDPDIRLDAINESEFVDKVLYCIKVYLAKQKKIKGLV